MRRRGRATLPTSPPRTRASPGSRRRGTDVLIYGHTHVPVVRRLGGTLVINPGSVGEGRPEPRGFVRSCAVLDTATGEARIIDLD
ncbi:metallophosphoesterase family protein [Novosphingobium resinovorum]|uniref:metallophosphoesterase family protein n=1 Tax=Novosphingobium resinovorum TaxID=158500 RepID=UPI003614250F